jgi:glucose dehydrogenase
MKRIMETVVTVGLTALSALAQQGAKNGEWRTYGGDLGNTHYSPLDQISATNFDKLEIAWRFRTSNLGPRPELSLESTPLMANGVLYAAAGTRRSVVALDAATGELLWQIAALAHWLRNHHLKEYDSRRRVLRAAGVSRLPVAG